MAENLQRQPAIGNLLNLDPLAVAPPVQQPRALADALQPRAFGLLPAAPQPSLPRHQPALLQMMNTDPFFTNMLAAHTGNKSLIQFLNDGVGHGPMQTEVLTCLHQTNLKILLFLKDRFSIFCPQRGELSLRLTQELKIIQELLVAHLSYTENPFHVDVLSVVASTIQQFHSRLDYRPILETISVLCKRISDHKLTATNHVMAVLNVIMIMVENKMTCCVLSASPSSSAIINAVFFIAVEREKELCELALEILQEYITTITNDVLELDRMLNEGSFVSFFKQTLHLLSHSNAETDGVAKLLYKTMQTMSYKKHYGRNKTSQRDLLMQLKSNVRKQSGKTVEEVEELISKIFGDATNELYFNFKFSFTQMFEDSHHLNPRTNTKHQKLSPRSKVSPGPSRRAQVVTVSSEEEEEHKSPAKKTPKHGKTPKRGVMRESDSEEDFVETTRYRRRYVEEEEEEEELKLATARKLGRRRSRSADRAPTGRTGPRTRAVSCKLRDRKRLQRIPSSDEEGQGEEETASSKSKVLPHAAAPQGRARRAAPALNPQQPAGPAMTPRRRAIAALRFQPQHGMQEQPALGSPVINSDRRRLVLIANNCSIHINALQ